MTISFYYLKIPKFYSKGFEILRSSRIFFINVAVFPPIM